MKARTALVALALALIGALLVTASYVASYRAGWQDLQRSAQRRLHFLATDLASALDRVDNLPIVLASHPELRELLQHPGDPARRQAVNERLAQLARDTHVAALFLIDRRGDTQAASNWNTPQSFVGQNYAFRPYFVDALQSGSGRFYAVGATTREPGYFLARAVRANDTTLGVVVVKISLDDVETNWQASGDWLMLADAHGVVFLASKPEWKFHTLQALSAPDLARMRATRQYGNAALTPLPMRRPAVGWLRDGSAWALTMAPRGPVLWVSAERAIDRTSWQLLSLADARPISDSARGRAIAVGFAYAFLVVVSLYAGLRRRRDEERRHARRELERASADLEQRIDERTTVLRDANDELARKIDELARTQATLRAAQDELVQAGKLAVLGQMAASITHEINQPLTALRALNDNAGLLLDRGDVASARANIGLINGLTQKIAAIVAQLKGFARKDELRDVPVPLAPVIEAACSLLASDARRAGVHLRVAPVPAGATAWGQAVRIEQVLVNLLRNAIDASGDTRADTVDVEVRVCRQSGASHGRPISGDAPGPSTPSDVDTVTIAVADRGPGIAPDVLPRLFEPFFTTKSAGQGLGLGLAISASIANALGGTLSVAPREGGGAVFTLTLRALS